MKAVSLLLETVLIPSLLGCVYATIKLLFWAARKEWA